MLTVAQIQSVLTVTLDLSMISVSYMVYYFLMFEKVGMHTVTSSVIFLNISNYIYIYFTFPGSINVYCVLFHGLFFIYCCKLRALFMLTVI